MGTHAPQSVQLQLRSTSYVRPELVLRLLTTSHAPIVTILLETGLELYMRPAEKEQYKDSSRWSPCNSSKQQPSLSIHHLLNSILHYQDAYFIPRFGSPPGWRLCRSTNKLQHHLWQPRHSESSTNQQPYSFQPRGPVPLPTTSSRS